MPKTENKTYSSRRSQQVQVEYAPEDFFEELSKPAPLHGKAANVLRMLVQTTNASQAAVFQVHEGYVLPRRFRWPGESSPSSNGYQLEYRNSLESLGIADWEVVLTDVK